MINNPFKCALRIRLWRDPLDQSNPRSISFWFPDIGISTSFQLARSGWFESL
jgi:hypothetical protein